MIISFRKEKDAQNEHLWEGLKSTAQRSARAVKDNYLSFSYNQQRILILVDYTRKEIEQLANDLLYSKDKARFKIHVGIGSNVQGFDGLAGNFQNAESALNLAVMKNRDLVFYEDLDIYKLVMGIENKSILKDYYSCFIGPLEAYDKENETSLVEIMQIYLENNASPQMVADKLFLHRNTVNNQLKKIEKITGYNPLDLRDRMKFYLAFYVKDML